MKVLQHAPLFIKSNRLNNNNNLFVLKCSVVNSLQKYNIKVECKEKRRKN